MCVRSHGEKKFGHADLPEKNILGGGLDYFKPGRVGAFGIVRSGVAAEMHAARHCEGSNGLSGMPAE